MWQRMQILVIGNAIVAVAYGWFWMSLSIVENFFRSPAPSRIPRIARKDVKAMLLIMTIWTSLWFFLQIMDGISWIAAR